MGFDVNVGLFLCTDPECEALWPVDERERLLYGVNATLRRLGLAEHREPRSLAEIDPPLEPEQRLVLDGADEVVVDPCLLGASLGSYSSLSRRFDRLDWLARHVSVRGTAPSTEPPYGPELYQAYETLTDRRLAFDHLLATCSQDVIVLPRPLDRVIYDVSSEECRVFVSAHRLRAEAVALGFVLRFTDPAISDSPLMDWITETPVDDRSFAALSARLPDDFDATQRWANEADLCNRLLQCATDVLRTGALGLTS